MSSLWAWSESSFTSTEWMLKARQGSTQLVLEQAAETSYWSDVAWGSTVWHAARSSLRSGLDEAPSAVSTTVSTIAERKGLSRASRFGAGGCVCGFSASNASSEIR